MVVFGSNMCVCLLTEHGTPIGTTDETYRRDRGDEAPIAAGSRTGEHASPRCAFRGHVPTSAGSDQWLPSVVVFPPLAVGAQNRVGRPRSLGIRSFVLPRRLCAPGSQSRTHIGDITSPRVATLNVTSVTPRELKGHLERNELVGVKDPAVFFREG